MKLTLDEEQAAAVAAVNGDIQVVARAGSGKTRALVTRAIFLQKHCGVSPHKILLLAFNKKAAVEIRDRLQKALADDVPHVMTFHALAYALVHPYEELVYDDASADEPKHSHEVQEVIDEHIQSSAFGNLIRKLMLAHFRQDWERIEDGRFILPMAEFLAHRRSLPRETLDGKRVKSFGEKLIANVLFENDIKYRYESKFCRSGVNYRPDFMIGSYGDGGVIIEYFGLSGDPDYDKMAEQKRRFWTKEAKWKFIEYSPTDIARFGESRFVAQLLSDLKHHGIHAHRLREDEIWQLVRKRAIDSFTKAMRQFLGRCRKLNLKEDDLHNRIAAHSCIGRAEEPFLQVGQSVYSGYIRKLGESGKEDFDGLMWRAVATVSNGQTRFTRERGSEQGDLRNLHFVMVDEFQDFSEMFSELLRSIRQHNSGVEFFCVGDDWQAINGFAGSDLKFFEKFQGYFCDTSRVHIRTNYRSVKAIVGAGNALMCGLGEPAKPLETAERGTVSLGNLDEFAPTALEQERHGDDELTPAVLRLVSDFLKRGMDVVLLSRQNRLSRFRCDQLHIVSITHPQGGCCDANSSAATPNHCSAWCCNHNNI